MPIPNTPKPKYPNVPMAPGVPPVLRQFGAVQNSIALLRADAANVLRLFQAPQWGLFTASGVSPFSSTPGGPLAFVVQLLGADEQSVVGVEYRQDQQISTAPQEQGAFRSYNKVSTPFNGRVTYAVGGDASARNAFLQQCGNLENSLDLLALVMPEFTYPSCNVVHHDFRRTARNGVSMFLVDIWVEEVRISGGAEFSNTQTTSGAAQVNTGSVQPQPLTPEQQAIVDAGGL